MAASALSTGGFIDPTKHAEYPIILSDRLSGKHTSRQARLININYNHKSKSATPHRRSIITRSSKGKDLYSLTVTDRAPNANQNTLTYLYEGSQDPTQHVSATERDLVLVFDSDRKAFVLEPVSTQLNFNLRSSPAKTEKQAIEDYTQLKTIQNEEHCLGDERLVDSDGGDDAPDSSNPYDFRHFLPKSNEPDRKATSSNSTPYAQSNTSKANSPQMPATTMPKKPAQNVKHKPKHQDNPLRQKKNTTKPTNKATAPSPKQSAKPPTSVDGEKVEGSKSPPSDTGSVLSSQKLAPSPGSNIIIDGDLIIDMGSPPPSRPTFKVNPAHFSSNNTPSNVADDGEDEMEDLRLPSPAGQSGQSAPRARVEAPQPAPNENEVEDDDELAAEMEAAFEQSAREEEEARNHQYQKPPSQQYQAASDDESEVSEEE